MFAAAVTSAAPELHCLAGVEFCKRDFVAGSNVHNIASTKFMTRTAGGAILLP